MQTEHLIKTIVKSVIKRVEHEWTRNQWVNTSYNVLSMQHSTSVFLILHVLSYTALGFLEFRVMDC